jgi:mono/diheme cytochrome c family protein
MLARISYFLLFFLIIIVSNNCQQKPFTHGRIMYENFCLNCHMEDGTGLEGNIPPLANADYLKKHKDELACIIRHGIVKEITVNGKVYNTPMEGTPQLKDVEIANIINYINNEWGNKNGYTTIQQVQQQLANCK